MEHDHQALDVPAPEIVVDNGEANSAANATGEPPAGNGGDRHLVDADEFKAIGTLCDNLASGGTMDIDIRLRQSNRPSPARTPGGGVAPVVQAAAAPGNVIAAAGLPAHVEQQQAAAAAPSTRLKITVAVDDIEPHQPHKADWEYLNNMRGWLMTVATLVVGITFQAIIQPPDWIQHVLISASDPSHHNDGAAAAPSPDAANQGGTIDDTAWTRYGQVSAMVYVFADLATFVTALAVVALLTHAPKTASARFTRTLVTQATCLFSLGLALTFLMALSSRSQGPIGVATILCAAMALIGAVIIIVLPLLNPLATHARAAILNVRGARGARRVGSAREARSQGIEVTPIQSPIQQA